MICEQCGNEHDGNYGSGRFCNSKCARAFSTAKNRAEISKKVSQSLKGHIVSNPFKVGYDSRRNYDFTEEDRKKAGDKIKLRCLDRLKSEEWNNLSLGRKKRRILVEQSNQCDQCGINRWNDKPLTLHLDHIDGNHNNDSRDNLRCICPNCHSQTSTYCNANGKKNKVSDEDILIALKEFTSIKSVLKKVGLSFQKYNYNRIRKLIDSNLPL